MSIEKNKYQEMIEDIKIGNSVAEQDFLLESARVETPVFDGVLNDRYDIILGKKGAGKTAIFKIINLVSEVLYKRRKIVILSGVNTSGESIFNEFKKQLLTFNEKDFETFWKFYFISLIYNEFIKNPKFKNDLLNSEEEIEKFIKECEKSGIPNIPTFQKKRQMIQWALGVIKPKLPKIKKASMGIDVDAHNQTLFSIKPEIEFDNTEIPPPENKEILFGENVGKALEELLEKSGLRIWIVLDRLDEVFERYSIVEFNGLRGLLIAYKNFVLDDNSDLLRVKLFLRDDIAEFLTDNKIYKKYFQGKNIPPLTAATHIFAKQSPILNWSEEEIEQLILNRLLLSSKLRFFVIGEEIGYEEVKTLLRNRENRRKFWNKIFPTMMGASTSLKWIFTRLKDGNGIVTPRSVIDMLDGATSHQKIKMSVNFEDCEEIFPLDSIKAGLTIASKNKLEKDIYNEFPREQDSIKKLGKEGKIKLEKDDLQRIFGKNWEDTISSLIRIGIIKYVKDSDTYRVEYLFRPALDMAYSS
jgi:hypothetical protein